MKRIIICLLVCMLVLFAVGCQRYMRGTEELIEQARKEFSISNAESIDVEYAGNSQINGKVLHWFIAGNPAQAHTYLAMECAIVEGKGHRFERSYEPMMRGEGIAVVQWNGGYAFCVNNRKCKTIKITDAIEKKEIDIAWKDNSRPFTYFNELIPDEYSFFDENGNELHGTKPMI